MPQFPKPFFRPSRRLWYVQLDGRQINLGPDRDAAFSEYHRLMAPRRVADPAYSPPAVQVCDEFLDWLQNRVAEGSKAPRTFDWYRGYLQSFCDTLPPGITAEKLKPAHVYKWVDGKPGWKTGKRGAMTAVQRAFAWAAKAGTIPRSPLAGLEKPAQGRREQLVSEGEYRAVLGAVKDQAFKDLLELSWETGARPHELFTVEAAFLDEPNARWVFPVKLSKGRKTQRVVYLTDKALAISKRLSAKNRRGPMLLNVDGKPWCVSSVKCRFQRLHKKLGTRYNLYSFRHAFVTRKLSVGGLDAVTVSLLAGHRDTSMISRHYAHLAQVPGHLRDAVNKGG